MDKKIVIVIDKKAMIVLFGVMVVFALIGATVANIYSDERRLDFGHDDIGRYVLFGYALPQSVIDDLLNEDSVIGVRQDDYETQIWVDKSKNGWEKVEQKAIIYDRVEELRDITTANLYGDCKNGIFLEDETLGVTYRIYINNGQFKKQLEPAGGFCL